MKLKNPFQSATHRLISKEEERQLYEKAGLDIENNNIDKGLWVKALSEAEGDEKKQKGIYIELLVERYKDELRAGKELERVLQIKAKNEETRQRKEAWKKKEDDFYDRTIEKFPKTSLFILLANGLCFIYIWWDIGFLGGLLVLFITGCLSGIVFWVLGIYNEIFS
tara:strand:+ start:288 stop:785 length:498 start_codon:yes stop_codon:yes gene_type:complete